MSKKPSYTAPIIEERNGCVPGRVLLSTVDLFHQKKKKKIEHPISRSARFGRLSMIQLFLEYGVDTNYQNAAGHTSLFIAAEHDHLKLLRFLLVKGASPILEDAWGKLPPFMQPIKGTGKFSKHFWSIWR